MERKSRILEPDVLSKSLPELLEQGGTFPLGITGSSMTPFLVHGRDTVYLSRVSGSLKKGDMILYRRDNGMLVLHRIVRVEDDRYTLVGDAQTELEPGIRPDQVLALVTSVCRKGKHLGKDSFCWSFFEKIWIRMIPARPMIMAVYGRLRSLFL